MTAFLVILALIIFIALIIYVIVEATWALLPLILLIWAIVMIVKICHDDKK